MTLGNLRGALRYSEAASAADEAAERINAVKSQIEKTDHLAGPPSDTLKTQLRSGLTELDSIRSFLQEGINSCNRHYIDAGVRDQNLQHALQHGLTDLEDVRRKLVNTLSSATKPKARPQSATVSGAKGDTSAGPGVTGTAKRWMQGNEAKPSLGQTYSNGAPGAKRSVQSKLRPSSAKKPSATFTSTLPSSAQGMRVEGVGKPNEENNTQYESLFTMADDRGRSRQPREQPQAPNPSDKAQPAAPPLGPRGVTAGGVKSRPSSAPNSRNTTTAPKGTGALPSAMGGGTPSTQQQQQDGEGGGEGNSSWGRYQDWAQSVLSRVQFKRAQQSRQLFKKRESVDVSGQQQQQQPTPTPPSAQQKPSATGATATKPGAQATQGKPVGAQGTGQPTPLQKTQSSVGTGQRSAQPPLRRVQSAGVRRPTEGATTAGGFSRPPSAGHTHTANAPAPAPAKNVTLTPQAQALREEGNVFFQQRKYAESARSYGRALEHEPNSETLYCNRAAANLMLNKHTEALQDALRAIDMDSSHVKAHWRGAKAHLYLGNLESARMLYTGAYRLADNASDIDTISAELRTVDLVEKCKRALRLREYQEAVKLADAIMEVFSSTGPSSYMWQCLKAEALLHIDANDASTLLSRICTDDNTFSEAWYLRGKALFYTGHDAVSTTTALGYLNKAKELDPKNMRAVTLIACVEIFAKLRDDGNSAYAAGKWQDAYVAYTKCLSVDAHNLSLKAIILCNRAAVCIQCERWKDALDDVNQSITMNPNNAKAFTRRARVYQHQGSHDLAIKDLQVAVQMYPSAENQERLQQAMDMKQQAQRQKSANQQKFYNFPGSAGATGGAGFHTSGSAGGASTGGAHQRPYTAGARRTHSAGPQRTASNQPREKTHYDTLGVPRDCDDKSLTKAYRDAALKWHPDKWASASAEQLAHAEKTFKNISTAYQTLRDAAKRRQYDLSTYF